MAVVITNQLPSIFPSWNNLRNYLLESNMLNNEVIELTFDLSNGVQKNGSDIRAIMYYRFHLDYIKAKCFDEFCSLEITANDVLSLDRMIKETYLLEEIKVQDKFRSMLNLFSTKHFR